jgi:hypothetical protein
MNCQEVREMSMKRRVVAFGAIACGLSLAFTPLASASTPRPAATWIPYNPTFVVQQQGCGKVSGLTFQLTCATTGGGFQRAERRYATYTGAHKFQGTFTISSLAGDRISLKQTFGSGPYFLLAVKHDGSLYSVEGGKPVAPAGTALPGKAVTVTTIQVGNTFEVDINGSKALSQSSPSGSFYDKVGAYATSTGHGPITVAWSNLQFWHQ